MIDYLRQKSLSMIDNVRQIRLFRAMPEAVAVGRDRLLAVLPRRRAFRYAVIASILTSLYWGIVASDRYVSEAHVVIHRIDGKGENASTLMAEQYLLRDHLLSVDMAGKLDERLNLRAHYSDRRRDPLSRMSSRDAPMEWFHRYYLSRISVAFDPSAAVLVIRAQAYDADTAHSIASMLVEEGEHYMNTLGQRMATEQVAFLEQQVAQLKEQLIQDRQAMITFQNQKGIAAPQHMAEQIAGIIGGLEAQLAELQTRRNAMQEYLMPNSTNIADVNMRIAAVEKQIAREKARLASPGGQALNRTVDEYQRLQLSAELSTEVYKTALSALERGRIEATRKLLQVSVLQMPTQPQYPLEPRRLYKIIMFNLVILMLAGVAHLLAAVIRDHKD